MTLLERMRECYAPTSWNRIPESERTLWREAADRIEALEEALQVHIDARGHLLNEEQCGCLLLRKNTASERLPEGK